MTDPRWDSAMSKNWGRWPSTRFVEWVMRNYTVSDIDEPPRFLELGCGWGAQLKFLTEEGFQAFGMDASMFAIEHCKARGFQVVYGELPGWDARGVTSSPPPLGPMLLDRPLWRGRFDCVFDVCTLQHLSLSEAAAVTAKARDWLKPDGKFFCMHAADGTTVLPRADIPPPRLLTFPQIATLFEGYKTRVTRELVVQGPAEIAHYIIEARKN